MIPSHGLFVGGAALGAALVLITEVLSLGHRLRPSWLAATWALACGIGLWALRRRPFVPSVASMTPTVPPWARWPIGGILAVTGITALLAPPNTWDSMTYHMPRVAHWSQAASVANYPTHITRQLWLGPWAEFAITHLYLLAGGDRLANIVQWLAFAGTVVGSAIVAGELGGNLSARALAAVACATLPMAIIQASSTQNDLVASFWILSLGHWVLRFREAPSVAPAALVGVSAGLAGLTKLPAWFVVAPWLIAFVALAGTRARPRAVRCVVVAALSAATLNLGHVARALPLFEGRGSPVAGSGEPSQLRLPPVWPPYINTTIDPRGLVSNAVRNGALHLVTPWNGPNGMLEKLVIEGHHVMRFDPNDERTTFGPRFRVQPFRLHEDFVGNPLHLLAGVVACVLVWRRRAALGTPARLWGWTSLAAALAFCAAVKWQPWNSRLHLPLFVLAAPLLGIALGYSRRATVIWATAFCLVALPGLALTSPRPLVGPQSVLTLPRSVQRFRNRPQLQAVYEAAADALTGLRCQRVGLVLGGDGWEYPFWPVLRARFGDGLRMDHALVENPSARFAPRDRVAPCALLVVGREIEPAVLSPGDRFV